MTYRIFERSTVVCLSGGWRSTFAGLWAMRSVDGPVEAVHVHREGVKDAKTEASEASALYAAQRLAAKLTQISVVKETSEKAEFMERMVCEAAAMGAVGIVFGRGGVFWARKMARIYGVAVYCPGAVRLSFLMRRSLDRRGIFAKRLS